MLYAEPLPLQEYFELIDDHLRCRVEFEVCVNERESLTRPAVPCRAETASRAAKRPQPGTDAEPRALLSRGPYQQTLTHPHHHPHHHTHHSPPHTHHTPSPHPHHHTHHTLTPSHHPLTLTTHTHSHTHTTHSPLTHHTHTPTHHPHTHTLTHTHTTHTTTPHHSHTLTTTPPLYQMHAAKRRISSTSCAHA